MESLADYDPNQVFNQLCDPYLAIRESKYTHLNQLKWLETQLSPVKHKKILELGCGAGKPVLDYFYQRDAEITGIDISSKMIDQARLNLPNATFIQGDMTHLSLGNKQYDAIFSFFCLFLLLSIDEQKKMFEKIFKALKPQGFTYFTLLSKHYTQVEEFSGFVPYLEQDLYVVHTSVEKYQALLNQIGFINLKLEVLNIGDEPLLWVYAQKP